VTPLQASRHVSRYRDRETIEIFLLAVVLGLAVSPIVAGLAICLGMGQ